MLIPTSHPWSPDQTLGETLESRGVSRRDFVAFCSQLSLILGLGPGATRKIAKALGAARRPSVIWLSLQECTGCVESALRSDDPTIGNLILDLVSLDFQENLMAAAGDQAEAAKAAAMKENDGKYLLIVTGSVPTAENGVYTTIGGRTARDQLVEAAKGAAAIIAVGACAHWGSVQAAKPNPTGAVGVHSIIRDRPVLNIAGCPPISDTITATIVHYLTFNRLPAVDQEGRPLFAYGKRIHDQCPRRAHFDAGQFVETFDDTAAREGWCLYEVGCKGPATFSPCPIFLWNNHTSWPIGAGHPCIGCTEPHFWDTMTPFYDRLPAVGGISVERNADLLGASLALGAVGGVLAHAAATGVHQVRERRRARELPIVEPPAGGDHHA